MSITTATSIEGNRQKLDGGAMFGNVPRAVWSQWYPPDDLGRIELATRALLIEKNNKTYLFETGIGAFFEPKLAQRFGLVSSEHDLLNNLEAAGHKEADIDYIILSHLHFDHAGGLLKTYQEGHSHQLCFSNATYLVGESAFERAVHPHKRDRASFISDLPDLLRQSERLKVITEASINLEGLKIDFVYSDGHTPGQMLSLIQGEKEKILFCGDLVPGSAWVHLPITMGYDRFPEKVIDEKSEIYQRASSENWWLYYTHDNQICSSQLEFNGKKYIAHNSQPEWEQKSF